MEPMDPLCIHHCCKTAIPYSQALRLQQICSEQENLMLPSQQIKQYLLKWGYSEQLLDSEIHRTVNVLREGSLLHSNR